MMVRSQREQRNRWLIGPEDGASRLLMDRGTHRSGLRVGLHKHDGEEAHLVLSGEVRFTVGGEHRTCRAGEAVVAPVGVEHGFVVLEETDMITVREQHLGTLVVVLEPDGSWREVEIFRNGPPWSKEPPPGTGLTPDEEVEALYRTTWHLL